MKLNRIMALGITVGSLCLTTHTARAQMNDDPIYRANELSLDLFGTGSLNKESIDNLSGARIRNNGRLGAGLGLNYFFTRFIGIGGDVYSEDTNHSLVDSASARLIGRLPIGYTGLAPYIFGGASRQFDNVLQWNAEAGGGLEYRFHQHCAVFIDARYVFADKTQDYGVARAGFRFVF